jgi:hypothetical protein
MPVPILNEEFNLVLQNLGTWHKEIHKTSTRTDEQTKADTLTFLEEVKAIK